jgi:CPA1 family monovalent cation:H+ antiporter
MALSLAPGIPFRQELLTMTFGVVTFSIVIQGLTMKPLVAFLGLKSTRQHTYDSLKVRRMAVSAAGAELDQMLASDLITPLIHRQLQSELEERGHSLTEALSAFQSNDPGLVQSEVEMARRRLAETEKSTVQRAATDGIIDVHAGEELMADLDRRLEDLGETPSGT